MIIHNSQIILASKSPRRRRLLENAGIEFTIMQSCVQENDFLLLKPENYVRTLAEAKAQDIADKYPEIWVIGADSIVLINDVILEKPESISDARQMIQQLSGNSHIVLTGYSIICNKKSYIFTDVVKTEVVFKKLTDEEIEWYIHTKEPYDKAGGYAIQGLGSFMIKSINGSYTNVVGLPVCEVLDQLYRQGVISRKIAFADLKTTTGKN
ncbi:MAG: septum formation inhibitor Maf [Desulfobacteraceae bacterium]|nr:septum formation inhibitor Maf [Desulfobacteraceae bacterium]MBC2755912.1 septum formation inhibitor Maf [Desulfobacteraceae bacterium]